MRLIRTIIWKEMTQLRNDPFLLRLMFVPIFLQLFVLGYALTTEIKNTPVTVLDRCRTPESRSLVRSITENRLFRFAGWAANEAQVREWLDRGKAKAGIIIPPDFSRSLELPEGAQIQLVSDGQDANGSMVAGGYIKAIVNRWSMDHFRHAVEAKGFRMEQLIPVEVRTSILFNPLLRSSWFMVPALGVILVTMITGLLTGFSIVREKESGTLEQLMVTPLSPYQLLLGKIVPFVIIGLLELLAVLAVAMFWFGIPFRGYLPTLLGFTLVYMFSSLGVGIFASTVARTPQQVMFIMFFFMIFFILLSGFFIPVENMPAWVRNVTRANPVRFFLIVMREVVLKGSGVRELWPQGVWLLGLGLVYFGGSVALFRRKVG